MYIKAFHLFKTSASVPILQKLQNVAKRWECMDLIVSTYVMCDRTFVCCAYMHESGKNCMRSPISYTSVKMEAIF